MPEDTRPGDVLAARYRLTDLLTESRGGRFWRAFDFVLQRDVAVHIIAETDDRAPLLREAARTSATVLDRRMLRVLDIDEAADRCFVVNEWGSGTSLDILLATAGPLPPAVAAWIVAEVADTLSQAHTAGVAHGRLVPENVLVDHDGAVRLIGFAVDAALHGLPSGRIRTDLLDLVGLLYASLTGKWAGSSTSAVPGAPTTHGHVLRPRQVRAGIPRTLDSLCDHVLNRGGDADVTAELISESLRDFLGESAAAAELWLARIEHSQDTGTVVLPELPDPPVSDPDFAAPAPADAVVEEEPGVATQQSPVEDLPTQAGMPVFHDGEDDVSWLARRSQPAPPPPPFEAPAPRPLFAPDPTEGEPVRRPRVTATPDRAGGGYWPWDDPVTAGSGLMPAVADEDAEGERSPGATMLRLAAIVGACLLLLIAVVIAYNLGRGKTVLGHSPTDGTSTPATTKSPSASAKPTVLTGVTADDFDPQGVPPEENPATVGNVVDHNPATSWQTSTYQQNLGPGGLKSGVGVTLDLGADKSVTEVDLTMVGAPTRLQVFVTKTAPTRIAGLTPAGGTTLTGTTGSVTLSRPVTGRYVIIWLTSLPQVGTQYRGAIAEAVVKGD